MLVSTPVVHWPVMGVLFVDAKGEPSCLFRVVVTRRGWCGSGSMLRWSRSMKCASGPPMRRVGSRMDRFRVQPTLAGLRSLTGRLAEMPGVVAVAEPTSMTWLGLSVALRDAGCDLSLLGARHAARLRGAISGKHKSDVIDADVLARAGEVFDLHPLRPVEPAQLALRRACVRAGRR